MTALLKNKRNLCAQRLMLWLVLLILSLPNSQAAEYDYQEVTADTPLTRYCYAREKAKHFATSGYVLDHFQKRFCAQLGAGWYVDKRKSEGQVFCKPCSGDANGFDRCAVRGVVVSCKHIKAMPTLRHTD